MTENARTAGMPEGAEGAQGTDESVRVMMEQLKKLHAADLGYEMTLSLASFASQKMGLTDDTAELRDLGDARLSIELLRALLDVLDAQGAESPAPGMRDALAQLQLAYAHAVRLAAAPTEHGTGEAKPRDAGQSSSADAAAGDTAPGDSDAASAHSGAPAEPAET
jgi:hypothetical protein